MARIGTDQSSQSLLTCFTIMADFFPKTMNLPGFNLKIKARINTVCTINTAVTTKLLVIFDSISIGKNKLISNILK